VTTDRVEQLKARLKREDEAKEEAFQNRLEEIRESQAEFRADQEAKERAEKQRRQKLHEDLRQRREKEMKEPALASWTASGGREADFEKAWPSLRVEMLKRRTLENEEQTRAAQAWRNARPSRPLVVGVRRPRGPQGVRALARG
jgi:hypothetical protein